MERWEQLQERQLERQQVMLEKVRLLALQSEESGGADQLAIFKGPIAACLDKLHISQKNQVAMYAVDTDKTFYPASLLPL